MGGPRCAALRQGGDNGPEPARWTTLAVLAEKLGYVLGAAVQWPTQGLDSLWVDSHRLGLRSPWFPEQGSRRSASSPA